VSLPEPSSTSTAVVTGASSGIGAELARGLAARGHGVTLVARSEDKLQALAGELSGKHGIRAEAIPCDLADPAARDRLAAEIARLGLRVDVLAANAGFGSYGPFVEADRERELEQVRVNGEAVVDLTARWTPGMAARGSGAVLITASVAGFQPLPGNATYSAIKAFAIAFGEALHVEVKPAGVTVTVLAPGPVHSGFQEASGAEKYAESLPGPMWRNADQVAAAGLEGLERGKRVVIPGAPNRLGALLGRYSPQPLVLRLMNTT
jgi:short-subunit dehydrogenase